MNNPQPKTLAMRKMEKNFIAHIEKKYPRKPYAYHPPSFFENRMKEELDELHWALKNRDIEGAKNELADISNLVDFLFEALDVWKPE